MGEVRGHPDWGGPWDPRTAPSSVVLPSDPLGDKVGHAGISIFNPTTTTKITCERGDYQIVSCLWPKKQPLLNRLLLPCMKKGPKECMLTPWAGRQAWKYPLPGTWRLEATSQVSVQGLPTGRLVLSDSDTQPPPHLASRRKTKWERQDLQWWPFQGKLSRTFQEASAARADHLVCLAEGAGSVATWHWGVMKGPALPSQHRPSSQDAQHKT